MPATVKQIKIGHDPDHSGGFPYLRICLDNATSPVFDTASYDRTYHFSVEIWQEVTNKSKRDAELDLASALHGVLNRLCGTWQLGTAVEGSAIESFPIRLAETNAGPMLVAPLKLSVLTLIQNPT